MRSELHIREFNVICPYSYVSSVLFSLKEPKHVFLTYIASSRHLVHDFRKAFLVSTWERQKRMCTLSLMMLSSIIILY